MDKQALRKTYLAKRNALSDEEVMHHSQAIMTHLKPLLRSAKRVSIFYPLGKEVNLLGLYENHPGHLCFPRVTQTGLAFFDVMDVSELSSSIFGLKEPLNQTVSVDKNTIDVMLIPGLVFGENGHRVGYGKGYYDNFLMDYPGIKIGVGFSFQLLKYLQGEHHDVKLDYIVTEKGVVRCEH